MKNMKRVAKTVGALGLVGCAVMTSPFATAADSGWIAGLNVGQSRAKINDAQINTNLLNAGLSPTSLPDDNRDYAYKIFGGYKFNKNFALEAGYFDLGQFGFSATTTPTGTLSGNIKVKGVNLDAVGILPLRDKFSVFGRLGLEYAVAKDNFTSTGAVPTPTNPNPNKNELNYKFGLGAQYDFTESVGLRGEWERFRINDAIGSRGDLNMYSIGLVVKLGKEKAAPAQQAATPPPRAVAAAPVLVVVPVVKIQKYCSVLDIQFEIKQQEVQREDKEKLAVMGTYMTKYPDTTAVIEGHTDNVGESDYNMKLSQQRADSVVDYLVNDLHIDRSRLTAKGYGDTRPIADNSTLEGKQANRRIDAVIACVTDIAGLKVQPARVTMAMELGYDEGKSNIGPEYLDGLRQVGDFLKANPSVTATVEAHGDKYVGIGSDRVETNPGEAMQLAQVRAQNVVDYLVNNQGISRSRLSTESYGSMGRVAYDITLEGQAENRRVNIILNYSK